MVKVKYTKEVTSPPDRKAKAGDTRSLPAKIAQRLAAEGYVEILDAKTPAASTAKKDA